MSVCGADCGACHMKEECKGCENTCGSPFGGKCIAATYIKYGGKKAYADFKSNLLKEVNALLKAEGIPEADALYELAGQFVNLAYRLPNQEEVRFLSDKDIYLGTQVEWPDMGLRFGIVADARFILISRYSVDGTDPAIILYKSR